ncbi:MAG: S8 family peptidase [Sulfitobacter sp.]|nr:S8 family peptidase [Sulfitobacter sp.]
MVFEVAETVDRFAKAVAKIEGMEFLADIEDEDLPPDEDFYLSDRQGRTEKTVGQTLYLVLANTRAAEELLSLWKGWTEDPEESFPRGLAPWRHVFAQLRDIRRWNASDRVAQTGLLDDWQFRIENGLGNVEAELDLWFRQSIEDRAESERHVQQLVEDVGGEVLATSTIPEIAYHGVAVRIPAPSVESLRETGADSIGLLRAEEIMFATPPSQVVVGGPAETTDAYDWPTVRPDGEPTVAILDGLPMANHRALAGRLRVDDPDEYETDYPAHRRKHGTAMASIICHGDLARPSGPLANPIYVRPLLVPDRTDTSEVRERFPEHHLPIDLVHRAVRRIVAGEGGQEPAAPAVQIINISLGDSSRPFIQHMSPWARLLDWLAYEHNLLFVVSAGNHSAELELDCAEDEFNDLDPVDLEVQAVRSIHRRALMNRLLSPAEALNVLTVGASNSDGGDDGPATATRVVLRSNPDVPAPYSPVGLGFRRSIKPDLLAPGGRRAYGSPLGGAASTVLRPMANVIYPPGILVAQPGQEGSDAAQHYSAGTSNAAALVTHHAGRIHESLRRLRSDSGGADLDDHYLPALVKALLVHAAGWGDGLDQLADALSVPSHEAKQQAIRLLGYGAPTFERSISGATGRALLLGTGELMDREQATFTLPLPPSLASITEWRRLTITLAWLSPIAQRSRRLRGARLWFEPPTDPLLLSRTQADWQAVKRGTVQHEVLEGNQAAAYVDGDSLAISVACRDDEGVVDTPVRFGLAVSLEVSQEVDLPIHAEIEDRLAIQVRPRA